MSFLTYQIGIFINHPIHTSLVAAIIAAVSFFFISGFVYTRVTLILINRRLLNVVFSMMTKKLNGPSSP